MFIRHKVLTLLLVILGGLFIYNYLVARTDCIPIKGTLFRWGDYERQENIKRALHNVAKYSPQDYDRICNRSSSIKLTRFEDQVVSRVPSHSFGAYFPNQTDHTLPGIIKIDRETAEGFQLSLEHTLVHEACHSFQIQTLGDSSEPPCTLRETLYSRLRPQDSLTERSAEFIKQSGAKFHTYCSLKSKETPPNLGDCVFRNYDVKAKNMCVNVFLKKGGVTGAEKEVCENIEPMGYKSIPFTLLLPPNTKDSNLYKFSFLPLNFE